MASLSGVVSIPRRLGEVTISEINRLTGVYRLYACGGGGGGGGTYVDGQAVYYGAPGFASLQPAHDRYIVPPIVTSGGDGGDVGRALVDGKAGLALSIQDAREVISSSVGGQGGERAITVRYLMAYESADRYVKHLGRFELQITASEPLQPYYTTNIGRGGSSTTVGRTGGIVAAFRIG